MAVKADNAHAWATGFHLFKEVVVTQLGANVHVTCGDEGLDDVLRCLLGQLDPFYFEADILHDGGDVISTGNFSAAGGFGGAVEIPGSAKPTAHHLGEGTFQSLAGFPMEGGNFPGGSGFFVLNGKPTAFFR